MVRYFDVHQQHVAFFTSLALNVRNALKYCLTVPHSSYAHLTSESWSVTLSITGESSTSSHSTDTSLLP